MKLKEFDNNSKTILLSFEEGEFEKFNIVGDYVLFDKSLNLSQLKLVKRGKSETTNYLLLDKEFKEHMALENGFCNAQILKSKNKKYLIVELN